jgi:hypothetical protein
MGPDLLKLSSPILQVEEWLYVGGINLLAVSYFILGSSVLSQLAIRIFTWGSIKDYSKRFSQTGFSKACALIFPVIFTNIEKSVVLR